MLRWLWVALIFSCGTANACAMFTISDQNDVLFANNEDYIQAGLMWLVPAAEGRYGRVNFGFDDDFAQGSMNEKGLCFDAAALPKVEWAADPNKKDIDNIAEHIMDTCATVEEAIAQFGIYNSHHLADGQFMFADATGASAVVTWDPQGHLSVVRKQGRHQLITNDRLEWSGLRDQRFVLAQRALQVQEEPSLESCRDTLNAIHQEGEAFTTYSNVFDLKRRRIYLYNMGDFQHVMELDLAEELSKGARTMVLRDLFPESPTPREVKKRPQRQFNTEIEMNEQNLNAFAGKYAIEGELKILLNFAVEAGKLMMTIEEKVVELFPESENGFRFRDTFGTITFHRAEDGRVTGLTMHRPGDAHARRVE